MKLRTKALLNHLNMFTDYMVSEVIHITARGSQSSQQVPLHLNSTLIHFSRLDYFFNNIDSFENKQHIKWSLNDFTKHFFFSISFQRISNNLTSRLQKEN